MNQKKNACIRFQFLAATVLTLCGGVAHATTWNVFAMHSPNALYFFDSDTVVRSGKTVTLWNKQVNDPLKPGADGSYSTAFRQRFDCAKRETQILAMVTYDRDQRLMRRYPGLGKVTAIAPDSGVLDAILTTACLPGFPKLVNGARFYVTRYNDEYRYAADYFAYLRQEDKGPTPD